MDPVLCFVVVVCFGAIFYLNERVAKLTQEVDALKIVSHEPVAIYPRIIGALREFAPELVAHIPVGSEGEESEREE